MILPCAGRGVSGTHFRIYISQDRTWMLRNESVNMTMINECPILGSEALNPDEPVCVRIYDIALYIHIINGWIAPEDCVSGPPQKFIPASSQSSTFQPLSIPKFILGESSKYHVLKRTPVAARGYHHAAIHVPTGRRCVAMVCKKASEEEQWRWRYNLIAAKSSQVGFYLTYWDFQQLTNIIE